ncbi:hypothetical protein [Roseicyclus sp.]|uniref:hypothetical protein n=1 Tax=Roseicyclus sp. TaxID=1914329 RepID=UPI003F6ADC13
MLVRITKGPSAMTLMPDVFQTLLSAASVGLAELHKLEAERTPDVALAEANAMMAVEEMQDWP